MLDQLQTLAHTRPNAVMVCFEEQQLSFAQMYEGAMRGAAWLAQSGVQPGDRVVVATSNRPLFLFYWFSILGCGAIAVPLAHDAFGDALRYAVQQSGARVVLAEEAEQERLVRELEGIGAAVHGFAGEPQFLAAVAAFSPLTCPAIAPQTPLGILYTSGTTGLPKGVVIPAQSYRAIGCKIVQGIGITEADRILTFLPLHHANPQMYSLMSVLTAGCSMVIAPRFTASGFEALVERYQPTGFTFVGTVLSILDKQLAVPQRSTLRWCVGGGAPLAVWREITRKLGVKVHELYGMTETGGMVTMNTLEAYREGSVGRARDDFEVAVLDDEDNLLHSGVGEICVRPKRPHVMTSGYFEKPQETVDASSNFWFHTGDRGRFDEDGYLYFVGRKKELIRRGGEMVSPVAIELVALKHPSVADCAAVGVPDDILDEEIKLVIVAKDPQGCAALPAQLAEHLAAQLPKHMRPRYFQFVDAIPKTPTQKVQRFKLVQIQGTIFDSKSASTTTQSLASAST